MDRPVKWREFGKNLANFLSNFSKTPYRAVSLSFQYFLIINFWKIDGKKVSENYPLSLSKNLVKLQLHLPGKYFTILHISAEAYLREKQRNDHLNNLGLKRRTSLRKSISKKLKRHKKQTNLNDQTSATTTASEAIEVVDNGGTNNSKKQQKSHCDVHEEPFRRPSYSGQSGSQSNIPSKVEFRGHP